MNHKYGLHGKLKATAGNGDKLADILLKASEMVATAKGCQVYFISREKANPEEVWVTEVWDSKEDHDDSLKATGVRELISQAMPLLDGMPKKGQELEVLASVRKSSGLLSEKT